MKTIFKECWYVIRFAFQLALGLIAIRFFVEYLVTPEEFATPHALGLAVFFFVLACAIPPPP